MAVSSRTNIFTRQPTPSQLDRVEPQLIPPRDRPAECESRCLMTGVELRADPSGKGPGTAVGYAAVFEPSTFDAGHFIETIRRGAFSDAVNQDVRALKNHDANYLLGRSKARSLRMVEDVLGLRVEIDLPDTQTGRDTAYEIKTGLLDGMSFSFSTDADEWDYSGDVPKRTLTKIRDLFDVGPVAFPAYTDTSIAMRSLNAKRPQGATSPPTAVPDQSTPRSVYEARLRVAAAF
jgi:uncharacterized protein